MTGTFKLLALLNLPISCYFCGNDDLLGSNFKSHLVGISFLDDVDIIVASNVHFDELHSLLNLRMSAEDLEDVDSVHLGCDYGRAAHLHDSLYRRALLAHDQANVTRREVEIQHATITLLVVAGTVVQ